MAAPRYLESFAVPRGAKVNIDKFHDRSSVLLVTAEPPMILECVSDRKPMLRTFHIIDNEPTRVSPGYHRYIVFNPVCNKETSTLRFTREDPSRSELKIRGTLEGDLKAEVGPSVHGIILSTEAIKQRLESGRKHAGRDAKIDIRLRLHDRAQPFSSHDKITVKFYLGECLFFKYVLSMAEDFHLLVHEGYNVNGNNARPCLKVHNPWPFGTKKIEYSLETTYI